MRSRLYGQVRDKDTHAFSCLLKFGDVYRALNCLLIHFMVAANINRLKVKALVLSVRDEIERFVSKYDKIFASKLECHWKDSGI